MLCDRIAGCQFAYNLVTCNCYYFKMDSLIRKQQLVVGSSKLYQFLSDLSKNIYDGVLLTV